MPTKNTAILSAFGDLCCGLLSFRHDVCFSVLYEFVYWIWVESCLTLRLFAKYVCTSFKNRNSLIRWLSNPVATARWCAACYYALRYHDLHISGYSAGTNVYSWIFFQFYLCSRQALKPTSGPEVEVVCRYYSVVAEADMSSRRKNKPRKVDSICSKLTEHGSKVAVSEADSTSNASSGSSQPIDTRSSTTQANEDKMEGT